jgi:hypothetical protein
MQQEHLTRDNGWQSDGSDLITYCAFPAAMDLVYLYTNDQCLRVWFTRLALLIATMKRSTRRFKINSL